MLSNSWWYLGNNQINDNHLEWIIPQRQHMNVCSSTSRKHKISLSFQILSILCYVSFLHFLPQHVNKKNSLVNTCIMKHTLKIFKCTQRKQFKRYFFDWVGSDSFGCALWPVCCLILTQWGWYSGSILNEQQLSRPTTLKLWPSCSLLWKL